MVKKPLQIQTEIPPALMVRLCDLIRESIGLHFPEKRWPDLQRNMMMLGRDLNIGDPATTAKWLLDQPPRSHAEREELLIRYLTIGETFFFRDQEVWELLKLTIIPERIRAHQAGEKKLVLWSAACSSGEEPYSMAMILAQIARLKSWDITILATDINRDFLAKAQKGEYSRWSFRNMNSWLKSHYFHKKGKNCYAISTSLKNRVLFQQLNLASDCYPARTNCTRGVDVIFCRNVLMYFPHQLREKIISRLSESLNPNGWLLLSASEVGFLEQSGLSGEFVDGVHVFRKRQGKPSLFPGFPCPPPVDPYPPSGQPQTLPADTAAPPPPAQADTTSPDPAPIPSPAGRKTSEELTKRICEADRAYQAGSYDQARNVLLGLLDDEHVRDQERYRELKGQTLALLAKVYANEGKLDDARDLGEQAIAVERLNPAHYYFLATVCQEQGHEQLAVKLLKQTLYLDSNFVLAHFQLAHLVENGDEARKHLKNTLTLLSPLTAESILAGSDGLTAGRVRETALAMLERRGKQ